MPSVAAPGSPCQAFPDPIPGILPFGTVSIFSAASGAGKTTMIAEWCARWQTGRTIFGHSTQMPTAIGYIAADRSWTRDHALWFAVAGAAPVSVYSLADDRHLLPNYLRAEGAMALFDHCRQQLALPPGALIILDPLTPLFVSGSCNDQRPVALTLMHLGRACREHHLTVLATAYFGKQKGDSKERYVRPIDRIAGSGVFAGYSHTQMYLVESEDLIEQPYHTFGWKPRHAPEEEFRVIRDPQSGLFIPYVGLTEEVVTEEELAERQVQILGLVPEDGAALGTLQAAAAKRLLLSERTIRRDIEGLLKQGLLVRPKYGWVSRPRYHKAN